MLVDLNMYKKLIDHYMSLDIKLKRINTCVNYQKQFNTNKPNPKPALTKATTLATPRLLLLTYNLTMFTTPVMLTTLAPKAYCLYTPVLATNKLVTCFNY